MRFSAQLGPTARGAHRDRPSRAGSSSSAAPSRPSSCASCRSTPTSSFPSARRRRTTRPCPLASAPVRALPAPRSATAKVADPQPGWQGSASPSRPIQAQMPAIQSSQRTSHRSQTSSLRSSACTPSRSCTRTRRARAPRTRGSSGTPKSLRRTSRGWMKGLWRGSTAFRARSRCARARFGRQRRPVSTSRHRWGEGAAANNALCLSEALRMGLSSIDWGASDKDALGARAEDIANDERGRWIVQQLQEREATFTKKEDIK